MLKQMLVEWTIRQCSQGQKFTIKMRLLNQSIINLDQLL